MAYAYAWDDSVRVSVNPALEQHYRLASVTAAAWLENHKDGDAPHFSGGQFASAENQRAWDLAQAVDVALQRLPKLAAENWLEVLTFAARGALLVRSHGYGAAGWTALAQTLPAARAAAQRAGAARRGR